MKRPEQRSSATVWRVARKEITLFFASPIAYLFLASFAAISLFVFFWGESFFARNIADVRPLFEWMPVLLIFLCATLTMRLWSEERRSGTLEHVLTQAVPLWHFVLGKFLGCLCLLVIALAVTLPLPITVALLGSLDWGPVVAGYLAALLMGAAYLSIGLFVSARSDNQIVSLISACALGGFFYLLGTDAFTGFFDTGTGELLRQLGSGSRFDAITRGVLDLRDLSYYLSLVVVFLALNTYVLERERWAARGNPSHHRGWRLGVALLLANAVALNLWLANVGWLRFDATEGRQYSISEATNSYLDQLREPLLLRGYFSAQTHPLLAPLVPQLRDLMREYEVAGDGLVRVEFIDPQADPEREEEANRRFGIQPVPFQVADRYQSAIVSSYFNVVVQYGDETEVLGFDDLIEVRAAGVGDIEVRLRNPEYDLTRAVRKVLQDYQAGGNLFETVQGELQFTAYVSDDEQLPDTLADYREAVTEVLARVQDQAGGRLQVAFVDPEAGGGDAARDIAEAYGFQPMTTSLFSDQRFYFYMTLARGDQVLQIPLDDMTVESFERNLDAAIKRFSSGFTRTVALVAPDTGPGYSPYGTGGPRFAQLEAFIGADLNIEREDLSDGAVSGNADVLMLVAPDALDRKALFAVDQFLMQGGTVIAYTSPFTASLDRSGFSLQRRDSGLQDWLAHHGLSMQQSLVLDPQNAALPVPVSRDLGGFQVQEMAMLDYPYLIDVRGDGLNSEHLVTADLPQLTLAWASPLTVTDAPGQRTTPLLYSSAQAWLSDAMDIAPRFDAAGRAGFVPGAERDRYLLGAIREGRFESYFKGEKSPLLEQASETEAGDADEAGEEREPDTLTLSSVIERSTESARIILVGSNDLLSDQVTGLMGAAQQSDYLGNLQFAANALDWSLQDAGLLGIRARGHFNRTLPPLERDTQLFWEYLNYALAALAIGLVAWMERRRRRRRRRLNDNLQLLAS